MLEEWRRHSGAEFFQFLIATRAFRFHALTMNLDARKTKRHRQLFLGCHGP